MRLRISLVIAAVAASAALAACGGDETTAPITTIGATGASGPAGSVTPETLIAQGDPICAEAYTALLSLPANVTGDQAATIVQGMIESLQAIGDPGPENKGDLDSFYSSLKTAEQDYKHGDATGAETALDQARAAASDYGFNDCGKKGSTISAAGTGTGGTGGTATTPGTSAPPATTEPAPAPTPTPNPTPTPPAGGTGNPPPAPPSTGGGGGGTGGNTGGVSPG
jgi:hypothetical protein